MMIGMVWRKLRGFIIAGVLVLAIAYANGSSFETLGWLSVLFLIAVGFLVFNAVQEKGPKVEETISDSVSEDLVRELNLLVQQIEDGANVMLGQVRKELWQIRSLVSDAIITLQDVFNNLNQASKTQNKMVLDVLDGLQRDITQKTGSTSEMIGKSLKDVSNITERIDHMVAGAVRSLQFEDIVRQLAESSEKHLDYLEGILGVVDVGMNNLNSRQLSVPEYIDGLSKLKLQIDQVESKCKSEAEKSVSQISLDDGEIVLFK